MSILKIIAIIIDALAMIMWLIQGNVPMAILFLGCIILLVVSELS